MRTLVTGATGFLGRALIKSLPSHHQVTAISRNIDSAKRKLEDSINIKAWNGVDPIAFEEPPFDQVVNLMGESIAEGRWTNAKKKRIRDSRILGTRKLIDGLLASGPPPKVFVSASAVGIYGDSGEAIVHEDHSKSNIFAASVCHDWEQEAMRLTDHGTRVVCLRIGIILGPGGGAIEKMLPIFRWGLGGRLGNGKQWMAWVHVDDVVGMILWSLNNDEVNGALNATAPNPVRNSEFTSSLASAVNRPAFLPAPKLALRVIFGEFANSLFFSQRVVPAKATELGYQFKFSDIGAALQDIV